MSLIGIILRWGFLIWELLFIYCGLFVIIFVVFLFFFVCVCVCCFFFHYVSAKFHLWPSSGDLPWPRIGMLSLVTVSPVITAFHTCCLSHHVFDQVNLWPAWVGFETAIFWQCSPFIGEKLWILQRTKWKSAFQRSYRKPTKSGGIIRYWLECSQLFVIMLSLHKNAL